MKLLTFTFACVALLMFAVPVYASKRCDYDHCIGFRRSVPIWFGARAASKKLCEVCDVSFYSCKASSRILFFF